MNGNQKESLFNLPESERFVMEDDNPYQDIKRRIKKIKQNSEKIEQLLKEIAVIADTSREPERAASTLLIMQTHEEWKMCLLEFFVKYF